MRKHLMILLAFSMSAGLFAQQRVGNVVKVQGHVHELLTKQAHEKRFAAPELRTPVGNVSNINPGDVDCWVGCTESVYPVLAIDTAYLLVKWTDGKAAIRGDNDSILIWGYRWVSQYQHPIYGPTNVTKYSIDMLRAVANFDCRFSVLLQNTGGGNFTVGGFGYNFDGFEEDRVPLEFDWTGAQGLVDRDTIQFHYTDVSNCLAPYNQFVVPVDPTPSTLVDRALNASKNTGVIKHPLDAAYSYPAYDYDFWVLPTPGNSDHEWQSGWTYNYWSFNVRQGLSGTFGYPTTSGVATETLSNNTTHYFVFASANYLIPVNLNGNYSTRACCTTYCTNCTPPILSK
ncbi:hypothetical protein [Massilibacteroides sp.]|uniref:hypothetical protein n=1 Tax=Massilibacteroides sp. TaxID=2034766 RepID=UPI002632695F|nr:hypothetical protein [Massilibacteroides sp.]MDD4515879.1 hypothetical protein [Massilibacteroides sp.]